MRDQRASSAPKSEPDAIAVTSLVEYSPTPSGLQTFRSLRHRNYRLLWFGTLFSSSGQWIQQVTIGWLTYDLTGSAFLLGAINGFRSIPLLLLGPFGGVAADRIDRKQLMVTTQIGLLISAFVFATIVISGRLEVWHIFVFTLLTGVGWAFNMPVRQSLVPAVVPKADLMNAVALNSMGFNITRVLGPTLAGVLIATLGAGENFYLQSFAYLGVAVMAIQLRLPERLPRLQQSSVRADLREGLVYVWRHPTLRLQMIMALVPVVIAFPVFSLMPVFAKDVLGQGPGGLGLMMAAPGIGAIMATLTLATLTNVERKGRLLIAAIFMLGVVLILFSVSRSFPLSLFILVLQGATQMVFLTTNQTLIQLSVPDELRGRVTGIYMLDQGLLPLGSLFAGTLAELASAPTAVFVMGALVSLLAIVFAWRAKSMLAL